MMGQSEYENTLTGFRDYNTDDGEDYWIVTPWMALQALVNELNSWPEARVLVPSTGEIYQGALRHLIFRIVAAVREGREIRVEPVVVSEYRGADSE